MNKARKKTYRQGTAKRLVRESLVLSSTRFVSSRVVRFFETGIASPLLTSVKTVDRFVRNKVTAPLFKKIELRKKYTMPARNTFASFVSSNSLVMRLGSFRNSLMNSSLRSVGIFLITFGIYAAAAFLLKRYISSTLGAANPDDLAISAITVIAGLLLTLFGDKSILQSVGHGRIIGSLLSGYLGVNDSTLDRLSKSPPQTSAGMSFLLGSLSGVITVFLSPAKVLLLLLAIILIGAVMCIPEFGLLLAAATISFLPLEYSAAITGVTLVSYFLKCLRLKRNFRFGSADTVAMIFFVSIFIAFMYSGGDVRRGEWYILAFVLLYFAVRNLVCSEKLLYQTFNALCGGLSVGMVLYILGAYAHKIPHEHIRNAVFSVSSNVLEPNMLAMFVAAVLPFAFSSFSALGTKKRDFGFVLLALVSAFVTDSFLFYALIAISLFVFIACAFKAPFGAFMSAAVVLPPVFVVLSDYAISSSVRAFTDITCDNSLLNMTLYSNFWSALNGIGGVVCVILFVMMLILALQRIFGCTLINYSAELSHLSGTASASAVMVLSCSFIFNPFADLRMILAIWFIFGLCGSVYKVSSASRSRWEE